MATIPTDHDGYVYDTFISHSSADHPRVRRLADKLREQGVRVWLDQQAILAGDHISLTIEDALERSRSILLCLTASSLDRPWVDFERAFFHLGDPTNSERRLIPVLLEDCAIPKALSAFRHIDYRTESKDALHEIVDACRRAGQPRKRVTGQLDTGELKARERYLRDMRESMTNILQESIHRARFIDLGIEDSPDAIRTPLLYENPERREALTNVLDAYQRAHERLLLLGSPGSGKSTCLYHLALNLIALAEQDPDAPVPFVQNLSAFPLESLEDRHRDAFRLGTRTWFVRERPDPSVKTWLIEQLRVQGQISGHQAQHWVETQRVVFLLDGLDEVGESRRIQFAIRLNETLLTACPHLPVVICSRSYEYLSIKDRPDAKLRLRAAAVLQPLSDADIFAYVEAARVPALASALTEDADLADLAKSPLMLSLMTLAYAGASRKEIDLTGSLTRRRHRLMETYVRQMLQRAARKRRGVPTDLPGYDVPESEYPYSVSRLYDYLGWLAIRMSRRMQTAVSPARFFTFLTATKRDLTFDESLAAHVAVACLVTLSAAVALLPIVRQDRTALPIAAAIIIGLPAVLLGSHVVATLTSKWRSVQALTTGARRALITVFVAIVVAQFSRSLAAIVPAMGPPLVAGLAGIITAGAGLAASGERDLKARRKTLLVAFTVLAATWLPPFIPWWRFLSLYVVRLHVPFVSLSDTPGFGQAWGQMVSILAFGADGGFAASLFVASVIVLTAFWLYICWQDYGRAIVVVFAAVLSLASLMFVAVPLTLPDSPVLWNATIVTAGFAGLAVAMLTDCSVTLTWSLLWALLGVMSLGQHGPVLFFVGAPLALNIIEAIESIGGINWWERVPLYTRVVDHLDNSVNRLFLTPIAWFVLAAMQRWPWRRRRFVSYCAASLILRHSSGYEFSHRRLRDYFAVQRLLPILQSDVQEHRLSAIDSLSYQGEAAIETLVDLIREGPQVISVAAATALGRIASPEAVAGINVALQHADPGVRCAMLGHLENIEPKKAEALLVEALEDEHPDVLAAALRALEHHSDVTVTRDPSHVRRVLDAHEDSEALVYALLKARVTFNRVDIPGWILPHCAACLADLDESAAANCLRILASSHYPLSAGVLARFLAPGISESTQVRALEAMVSCAPEEAGPYLIEAVLGRRRHLRAAAADYWPRLETLQRLPYWNFVVLQAARRMKQGPPLSQPFSPTAWWEYLRAGWTLTKYRTARRQRRDVR